MRKSYLFAAPVIAVALLLGACNQEQQATEQKTAAEQAPVAVPLPTDPANTAAWKQYLVGVVTQNMQGVTSGRPYMYFVPAGDDEKAKTDRANQLENVQTTVSRGVLPGNMMAFGGPNSTATADLIATAFKEAQTGSFKNVVVLFIGTPADSDRIKTILEPSGATFRFVEMK